MIRPAPHPSLALIEDQLDAVGQKSRVLHLIRGAAIFLTTAVTCSLTAAALASWTGPGHLARLVLILWAGILTAAAAWWIVRPLLMRPRTIEVARLIESRVQGLHNGLTNSVLLARSRDLQNNPWLGAIYDEVLGCASSLPIGSAVSLAEIRPLLLRLTVAILSLLALLAIPSVRANLGQGWRQMFSPQAFLPRAGSVRIIEIQPTQITLICGQPLEISILAEDPRRGTPVAELIFGDIDLPPARLTPAILEDNRLRYTYRLDHLEQSLRFRVEIERSQSQWCQVTVVRQVRLQEIMLQITPPTYTHLSPQTLALKDDQIGKTQVSVLEGSLVEVSAVVDVPVRSAMLRLDELPPFEMAASRQGRRFTGSVILMREATLAVLLKEGSQIIATVPDPPLRIAVTPDTAPSVRMKWPAQDLAVPPEHELKIQASLNDDRGLAGARVLLSTAAEAPLAPAHEAVFPDHTTSADLAHVLNVPRSLRVHGQSIRVQVEVTDNRDFSTLLNAGPGAPGSRQQTGPQKSASPIIEIRFRDPEVIAKEQAAQLDQLRSLLLELIRRQQELLAMSSAWRPSDPTMARILAGQVELRRMMLAAAEGFPFPAEERIVQKTLLVLAHSTAMDAVNLARSIQTELVESEKIHQNHLLQSKQRRIAETLEALLSRVNAATAPATQAAARGGDLENAKQKYRDLAEALEKFLAEEKRILDATAHLAKKPVDDYDAEDRKLLEELKLAQEKLDAFMQEKVSDFSKLAEQDMANASLLKELLEVYSEVTMAKDALKKQAIEMAIPLEEMALELARSLESNIEKWLMDEPDRLKWNQEDPLEKVDVPMAELPRELEDMVGQLLEQQEDLFEEIEDTAANWADSLDKGAGWDAMDGPIANMSAKGVTGNVLPNNNEMGGRSGEGRSGKSSGEMVEETASGKGGRNTPTRLDPTPFQLGQIKDESRDPVGGATGGGKLSGQGGAGLEGPVPGRDLREQMQRLAQKQAELRNSAERLDLDKKLGRYDNFKLMEAAAIMRRLESDLHTNRYENALRRKDVLLDRLETSHLLLSGQLHLQRDTTPKPSDRLEDQIHDVLNGELPPAWTEALKEYYRKLGQQ